MNAKLLPFICIIFCVQLIEAQYDFSSHTVHASIIKAIEVNSDVIKGRTLAFEKKANDKPLMFVNTKKKISELNRVSNNLSYYIEKLQEEANSERILQDLLEEGFYEKLLFDARSNLTPKGEKLKVKVDSLYQVGRQINNHGLTGLTYFANSHFKTDKVYYDAYENEIDYFKHVFTDKSNYGIMMQLYCLLLDVKTFQLLYYQTVMSF